jgi:hypothetical protein
MHLCVHVVCMVMQAAIRASPQKQQTCWITNRYQQQPGHTMCHQQLHKHPPLWFTPPHLVQRDCAAALRDVKAASDRQVTGMMVSVVHMLCSHWHVWDMRFMQATQG